MLSYASEALTALSAALDGEFVRAVDTILAAQEDGKGGRVIVSGMGKSGHIARKIAATLSSTGTPAYFVHPAEASHGDLGAITAGRCAADAVLGRRDGGTVRSDHLCQALPHSR